MHCRFRKKAAFQLGKRCKYKNEERKNMEKTMEKIVALAKARGFVYPGSEIYGGL
ncbi:hypothetical protein EVA_11108, partial [gut metagenome]